MTAPAAGKLKDATEPQTLFRKVSVWERGSSERPAEIGVCAFCDFNRLLAFDIAYDWELGVSRELLSICDSCYIDLASRSKALAAASESSALAELRAKVERSKFTAPKFIGSRGKRIWKLAMDLVLAEIDALKAKEGQKPR